MISLPQSWARAPAPHDLTQTLNAQEEVDAKQRQGGPAPDHYGAFPAEGTGDFLPATPGDQESFVVGFPHQHHRRMWIESIRGRGRTCIPVGAVAPDGRSRGIGEDLYTGVGHACRGN